MIKEQLSIAFGKYVAGYRPGDELWSEEDQRALDYVLDPQDTLNKHEKDNEQDK